EFSLNYIFFFQAEDGIRDFHVTGVQTCALPIWEFGSFILEDYEDQYEFVLFGEDYLKHKYFLQENMMVGLRVMFSERVFRDRERSEERRVGKECRSGWSTHD